MMTLPEVARLLGKHPATVWRWAKRGYFGPGVYQPGGRQGDLLFDPEALDYFRNRWRLKPAAPQRGAKTSLRARAMAKAAIREVLGRAS